jgi:hypothetical protein
LAAGLAFSSAAQAQQFLRPLNADGIGKAEWSQLSAAAKKLYNPTMQAEGAVETWTTPSGAAGSVTLERIETRPDGSPCVVLLHEVTTPQLASAKTGRSHRCRQPNGTWLVSAE